MNNFLCTDKMVVMDSQQKPVVLKGVNLGGWLMMEGYILHGPNRAESVFKNAFKKSLGAKCLKDFEQTFRRNFITEQDIVRMAGMGINCLRVPFNHKLIESKPFVFDIQGCGYLDRVIRWAGRHGMRVILDMHAAPGCQNCDWHGDSDGKSELFTKRRNQDRMVALWEFLADRYKNNPHVAGYDLMNEAEAKDTVQLNRLIRRLIKAIRGIDRHHIIFIEGNKWATDLACLDPVEDDNYILSIHTYEPVDMTFNFVPHLHYPTRVGGRHYSRSLLQRHCAQYQRLAKRHQAPIFVGEFGVNYRQGHAGEDQWLADQLSIFESYGWHWTYWTYKAVKNNVFPDGLFSYYENPPWVNRLGPDMGIDTYARLWPGHQRAMAKSWRSDQFRENTKITQVIKEYV